MRLDSAWRNSIFIEVSVKPHRLKGLNLKIPHSTMRGQLSTTINILMDSTYEYPDDNEEDREPYPLQHSGEGRISGIGNDGFENLQQNPESIFVVEKQTNTIKSLLFDGCESDSIQVQKLQYCQMVSTTIKQYEKQQNKRSKAKQLLMKPLPLSH